MAEVYGPREPFLGAGVISVDARPALPVEFADFCCGRAIAGVQRPLKPALRRSPVAFQAAVAVAVEKANASIALRFAGAGRPFVINMGLGKILRLALALPAHFAKTEQGAALSQIGQPVVEARAVVKSSSSRAKSA